VGPEDGVGYGSGIAGEGRAQVAWQDAPMTKAPGVDQSATGTARFRDAEVTLGGITGETIEFPSADPLNYHSVLSAPEALPPRTIDGKLFVPNGATHPSAAIIVVPGSLGIAPSHLMHAETFLSLGIAVFVIDPFGPRSVTSTVADQTQYSFAASAYDVLAAFRVLADRREIDIGRIGAQGHSRGGSAVLSAAIRRFAEPVIGSDCRLAAVYAAYPWCGHQFTDPDLGGTVVRAIIGERDEWCSAQQVQAFVHAMRLVGGDVTFRLVAGAHHSFDRHQPHQNLAEASVSPHAPTVYLDDSGAMIHPVTGLADPASVDRDLMVYAVKAGYGHRGAVIGSSGNEATLFRDDMAAFWTDAFGVGRERPRNRKRAV
jgi:dienelactone hydrolase